MFSKIKVPQLKKIPEGSSLLLDLLRAISVQLVLVGHGINFCSIWPNLKPPYAPYMQNIAVLIFFILSGYLISHSLFRKVQVIPNYNFSSYIIDRFSRIYTALIPALIFVGLLDLYSIHLNSITYSYHNAFDLKTFIGNLFMLQDFPLQKHIGITLTSFGSARPLWTLAIEWWIYMWFGYGILKLRNRKFSVTNTLVFGLLSIVPFVNLIAGRGNGLTAYWLFGLVVCIGLSRYQYAIKSNWLKLCLIALLLSIATLRVMETKEAYEPLFSFLLAALLLVAIDLFKNLNFPKLAASIIKVVANYSYTLYLIHYSIFDLITKEFSHLFTPQQLLVVGVVSSNITAFIVGYYSETRLTTVIKTALRKAFSAQ